MRSLLVGGVIASLCIPGSYGWWDAGHMTVAAVAQRYLEQNYPSQLSIIQKLLQYQSSQSDYPGWSVLINSAIWADHIKCKQSNHVDCDSSGNAGVRVDDMQMFFDWHFVDIPYKPEQISAGSGILSDVDALAIANNGTLLGAATTISNIEGDLIKTDAPDNHGTPYAYDLQLRLLIHIMGDIAQPLHATSMFSSLTSGGPDQGGNLISITCTDCEKYSVSNLHSLWDSMCLQRTISWPGFGESDAYDAAGQLIAEFPVENYDPSESYNQTLLESYHLVTEFVYSELFNPTTGELNTTNWQSNKLAVSDEYLSKCQTLTRERVAAAGYRLGYILSQIATDTKSGVLDASEYKLRGHSGAPKTISSIGVGLFILIAIYGSNFMKTH